MLFPFERNFCGALCQKVVSLCTKLLWCSLSKYCFPLYELLWCSLSKCCFLFYETYMVLLVEMLFLFVWTDVVFLVKLLFPFLRNLYGAPCQNIISPCAKLLWCSLSNVVSLCKKLVLLVVVLFPKSINIFVYSTFPFYSRNGANRDSDSLRTGRSGDRISIEKKFSVPVQSDPKPIQPPRQWMPGILRG